MSSLEAQVDAVKAALAPSSTCTPSTITTLRRLLQSKDTDKLKTTTATPAKTPKTPSRARKTAPKEETLDVKEQSALATFVVNSTLKTLSEASKTQPKPSKPESSNPEPRKGLRRSLSTPLSPAQARTLNRTATMPIDATKPTKSTSASPSSKYAPVAECARIAFACLRRMKGAIAKDQVDFQLETGMVTLAAKMLAVGLTDMAYQELRILKSRLEMEEVESEATDNTTRVEDLLHFQTAMCEKRLPIVANCQVQTLKLIASTKKPTQIEGSLRYLKKECDTSPSRILERYAGQGPSDAQKAARLLAQYSSALLSLAPSISSAEDSNALEPRLSPSPATAFQLQTIAFESQISWWKLLGHKGKPEEELLAPFSRCLRCFARRAPTDPATYTLMSSAFSGIKDGLQAQGYTLSDSENSPMYVIHSCLGAMAHTHRQYADAVRWYNSIRDVLQSPQEPSVRICSLSARILAAILKTEKSGESEEKLVANVIESFNAPLCGTGAEVNELLESLSLARRSVAGLLMQNWDSKSGISSLLKELLKKFLLQFPRFVRRWLGTPPSGDTSTKQMLQFDQRRQAVQPSLSQVLDGTLIIVKSEIGSDWQMLDDVLQDCTTLLRNSHDPALPQAKLDQLASYDVKISSLYFSIYSQYRKTIESPKSKKLALLALKRSIDVVQDGTAEQREKAQLSVKLEIMADLCKDTGHPEQASKTLRSICTSMVEEGVLATVSSSLSIKSPRQAWSETEKASTLSRSLRSIARLDDTWNDWTFFMAETERAAVLEHLLQISAEDSQKPLKLHDPGMGALLRIYTPEKYPIRRLRVLLKLFAHQIGQKSGNLRDVSALCDQALRHTNKKDMADDAGLSKFVPHLHLLHASTTALASVDDPFPVEALQTSVTSWTELLQGCSCEADVLNRIDEPDALLRHLLSVNQLSSLRGESRLQLSVLELCVHLAKLYAGPSSDEVVAFHCKLATQYINIGLFTEASKTLEELRNLMQQNRQPAPMTMTQLYLAQAEYMAGVDDAKSALACLSKVATSSAQGAKSSVQDMVAAAQASLIRSGLALRSGDIQQALESTRNMVRLLSHEWTRLEGASLAAVAAENRTLAESVLGKAHPKISRAPFGPQLWALAPPLFENLMLLSSIHAHVGMYQETLFYCETAMRVAEGSGSSLFLATASARAASIFVKSEQTEKGLEHLGVACTHMPAQACAARVKLAKQIAEVHRELGDEVKVAEYLAIAEETTRQLGQLHGPAASTTTRRAPVARTTRATSSRTAAKGSTKASTTTRAVKRAPAASKTAQATASAPQDTFQASLLASVLLSRASAAMQKQDWKNVASSLELVKGLPKLFGALRQEQLITATRYLCMSAEQMNDDPVFSIMHESTISFPAVVGVAEKSKRESLSPGFAEALKQAQEVLLEAHESALVNGENALLHRIATLLQSTVISLTAASGPATTAVIRSESTTVAVELARNAMWKREQLTIESSKETKDAPDGVASALAEQLAGLELQSDMGRFQQHFIELIPKKWNVISMSLSENHRDLCITKFQAGHSPFILRLPLERANSRDADSEIFNFQHGRDEMLDVIANANRTSHSGGDMTSRAGRNAWWAEREALDERLKELLLIMETTWLGGFKGIFSHHQRRPDLLARFQRSFHQLLERTLPSRNGGGGGRGKKKAAKSTPATLDPRILDLFIGLGDPTDPTVDFDEALNDLLYFVVDILQFHGEHNAYDEIDFDAMVVETYDALRGYYAALRADGDDSSAGTHTILVLDKALHIFPWESMPCLKELPVSRVPSLAALRRLITEAKASKDKMNDGGDDVADGHYISPQEGGSYILNPSSDLKNTQSYFQSSFETLPSTWTSHVNVAPTESALQEAYASSPILLYFGHGGGAQYIRAKRVRSIPKISSTAFLMGCSSAALNRAGEFEVYGLVWNLMVGGCPGVVGTLWDVTDRDIDRFAGRCFEQWGLFPRGTFKDDGKGTSAYGDEEEQGGHCSLAEAVMKARAACRFRYLNAAAVVMYGIPVYI
ncbi:cell division-associated protein bimb, partial [Emericellopsis atlantica]